MKKNHPKRVILVFEIILLSLLSDHANGVGHRYAVGDDVQLWVNKVGPYANPQEAYDYYTLPYCAPETDHHPEKKESTGLYNQIKSHSIGEALGGHTLRHTGHDLKFATYSGDQPIAEECTTGTLSEADAAKFTRAAEDQWFYQMYVDDLPFWGMVGEMLPDLKQGEKKKNESDLDYLDKSVGHHAAEGEELKPYVYTERTLVVFYNDNRIIKVDLHSDPKSLLEVKAGSVYNFKLFIKWEHTEDEFHSRFDRYLDHAFFKHQIHWFSIFNSFMMVLFLMGLVALILLRTLRKDYARYALARDVEDGDIMDDEVDENGKPLLGADARGGGGGGGGALPNEDSGWKQVHGDVFRAPQYLPLFAALLGTGWQLVVLTLGVILFTIAGPVHGEVHEERGELMHAILACYALSSIVAGYSGGSYFKRYYSTSPGASATAHHHGRLKSGTSASAAGSAAMWQATMFLTVILLPTVIASIVTFLNAISLYYGTIMYIPFLALLKLFAIWIFVSVPLCIVGTLLGRHAKLPGGKGGGGPSSSAPALLEHFPCRVNAIPRPIPEDVPWYGKPQNLIPYAGLLSFGSIFIELYYVLTSLWNYKFYHVYGFLLGVYTILCIVVCMTTIIVVYFCLNAENYQWQWTSFASGASTAFYVFLYGVYYFLFKTAMNGFLQTMFYFGYMTLISLNLGTLCGTVGHFAASQFVRTIFQNVKVD